MKKLIRFLKVYHFLLMFLVAETICLFLFFSNNKFQKNAISEKSLEYSSKVYKKIDDFERYMQLDEEIKILHKENANLKSLNSNIDTLIDNISVPYKYIEAKIIKNTVFNTDNYLIINKGKKHGITPGMGIVTDSGVIGKVILSSENYSKALSILNTRNSISINIPCRNKNNNIIMFKGDLTWKGTNHMNGVVEKFKLSEGYTINIGDVIKTSGNSLVFPENIPLARIESTYQNQEDGLLMINAIFINNMLSSRNVYIPVSLHKNELDSLDYLATDSLIR